MLTIRPMAAENSEFAMDDWKPVMRQVIIRAICDALGYTNIPPKKREHSELVKTAQAWFLQDEDFEIICDIAEVDATKIKTVARLLIQAKASGDYSRIPDFWTAIFRGTRQPNLSSIERALDRMNKLG